jgi:hypothetical protein
VGGRGGETGRGMGREGGRKGGRGGKGRGMYASIHQGGSEALLCHCIMECSDILQTTPTSGIPVGFYNGSLRICFVTNALKI